MDVIFSKFVHVCKNLILEMRQGRRERSGIKCEGESNL
jgi:hypothetical protein